MNTTEEKIGLYEDALLRWLAARRDHKLLHHPEPDRDTFKLDEWTATKTKERVERDFNRSI